MAKQDYIQFASNTLKYEKDTYIRGANSLYCFQFGTGTNRDLRQELVNYHAKKNGITELIKDPSTHKNIGDCFWGIFKKPEGQSYEEFVEDVKNGKVGFIGNSPIIPTGRDYTRVDCNGNLLVATINSNLENYYDGCGNMLIDGQTGEVIRAPKPSVIILPAEERTGFYPIEVYKTRENKETGNQEVYDREFNFLSPEGKILTSEYNFSCGEDGEAKIYEVPRNFYAREGKRVFNDWKIYPTAYVFAKWNTTELYLSALEVVIENRRRIKAGEMPLVNAEFEYLKQHYLRMRELEVEVETLGRGLDNGALSQQMYQKALDSINEEYALIEYFETNLKTEDDARLEESLFGSQQQGR